MDANGALTIAYAQETEFVSSQLAGTLFPFRRETTFLKQNSAVVLECYYLQLGNLLQEILLLEPPKEHSFIVIGLLKPLSRYTSFNPRLRKQFHAETFIWSILRFRILNWTGATRLYRHLAITVWYNLTKIWVPYWCLIVEYKSCIEIRDVSISSKSKWNSESYILNCI